MTTRSMLYGCLLFLAACAAGGSNGRDAGSDAAPDQSSGSCGDGIVDPLTETCDTAITSGLGMCPTECIDNDGEPCSTVTLVGSGCTRSCQFGLAGCTHGDGCCLGGCDSTMDDDCSGVCGNGVREGSETCDGDCPTSPASCNDDDACTQETLTGTASSCNVACARSPIVACASGDGCCPSGCTTANDDDCTTGCGNGVVEPPELCDENCPSTCDDNDACTTDTQTGSAATCNVACSSAAITTCTNGDGCCPSPSCNPSNDDDCGGSGTCTLEYELVPRIRFFGTGNLRSDIETDLPGGHLVLQVTADGSGNAIAGPAEMLNVWFDAEFTQVGCVVVILWCSEFDIESNLNIFAATCNATRLIGTTAPPPEICNYADSTTTGAVGTFNGSNTLTWGECARHGDYDGSFGVNYAPLDTALSIGPGCAKNFRTVGRVDCESSESQCDDYGFRDGDRAEDLLYNQPLQPLTFSNGLDNVAMDWINLPNTRPGGMYLRFTGARLGGSCN